jgi:hypothetical protein
MQPGYADVIKPLDVVAQRFGGDCRFFGDRDVACPRCCHDNQSAWVCFYFA